MNLSTASLLLFISAAPLTTAFAPTARFAATRTAQSIKDTSYASSTSLFSSTDTNINYVISGDNIEVTEALNGYVNKKLDNVIGKLATSGAVKECDVHLSVNKNPKVKNAHKAEVVTYLKGVVIRCAEESQDMYASIDAVTDRLASKLRKYKERRLDGYHGGPNMGENLANVLDEVSNLAPPLESAGANDVEDYVDPEAPVVTKIKSYDLSKPISVEEAIFALGYVDHDFYVFREKESNEINVVYKRNAGGYGLIGPE